MNFSNNAFRPSATKSTLSNDTMDHSRMVMACRFGWTALPDDGLPPPRNSGLASIPVTPSQPSVGLLNKRFVPCRGRLYHQLSCSHRIRTDMVEKCGSNCLDPLAQASSIGFYCSECVETEATQIWTARKAEHNAMYPPIDEMSKEQYEQWYNEHCQLQAQFAEDRVVYEADLQIKARPSNPCSAMEASKEEMDFAAEMDSLSLRLIPSEDTEVQLPPTRISRRNLPDDPSEQLHWGLNALSLDRGSCGVEYTASHPPNASRSIIADEQEL